MVYALGLNIRIVYLDSGTVRRRTALLKNVPRCRRLVTVSTDGLTTCSNRPSPFCLSSVRNEDSSALRVDSYNWLMKKRNWPKMLRNEKGIRKLENVAIVNALQLEAVRLRACRFGLFWPRLHMRTNYFVASDQNSDIAVRFRRPIFPKIEQ